jgi:hypothetical protein
LADIHFAHAKTIVLVQDNLSTHSKASLYEAFPALEARRLVERFEYRRLALATLTTLQRLPTFSLRALAFLLTSVWSGSKRPCRSFVMAAQHLFIYITQPTALVHSLE